MKAIADEGVAIDDWTPRAARTIDRGDCRQSRRLSPWGCLGGVGWRKQNENARIVAKEKPQCYQHLGRRPGRAKRPGKLILSH